MIFQLDSGLEPSCPICGPASGDWCTCGHLVALLDRTFAECCGGALYLRENEEVGLIESAFLDRAVEGGSQKFGCQDLEELWESSNFPSLKPFQADSIVEVEFDAFVPQRVFVARLIDAGAFELAGTWEDGVPMSASIYTILFASMPDQVIDSMLRKLAVDLRSKRSV